MILYIILNKNFILSAHCLIYNSCSTWIIHILINVWVTKKPNVRPPIVFNFRLLCLYLINLETCKMKVIIWSNICRWYNIFIYTVLNNIINHNIIFRCRVLETTTLTSLPSPRYTQNSIRRWFHSTYCVTICPL